MKWPTVGTAVTIPMRHALLALLVAASPSAQEVPAPERFATARRVLEAAVDAGTVPAVSVAVLDDDHIVWAQGFGIADRSRAKAATADTIYRLASISKPFTATAVMRLVERGQLDLDQPANRYLVDAQIRARAGAAEQVTLRRLLNHTAGLPTHWNFFYAASGDSSAEQPPLRARSIAAYAFTAYEPGTRTNYSNLAFGILDHIVATVGKQDFRTMLRTEVCDPLGMASTDLGVRPDRLDAAAVGYRRVGEQWTPVPDYGFDHDGASAVRSSARDLLQLARLLIHDGEVDGTRVLSRESTRAMRERRGSKAGSNYGVAWDVGQVRGTLVLRHSGGMPGVSTLLQVFPERRAALAVLTNGADRGVTARCVAAVLDALLGPEAPEAPEPTGPKEPAAAEPAAAVAVVPRGRWQGTINHPDGDLPIAVEVGGPASARLWFGADEVELAKAEATAERLTLRCRDAFATGHATTAIPVLDFELRRDGEGWVGVVYATIDGICKLPHWVSLEPRR